jgi:hypothetical protein
MEKLTYREIQNLGYDPSIYNPNTFQSKIGRKVAHWVAYWLWEINTNTWLNHKKDTPYWEKRSELLGYAQEVTTVKHIHYYNMKYHLRFYAELFQYNLARLLGLAE